ncbi:MAG TPA: PGDYG domain-containing protein, partial [Steroidobacteraceae bacterium]
MSPQAPLLYRSSGQPGYLPQITADARRVVARKLERAVQVRFTDAACEIHTREGIVRAKPGDAIITGTGGEQWRVSRARFAEKYRPQPPLETGHSGAYLSLKYWIHAVPMRKAFEVLLADGESRLSGRAGDWLVDYGDGSLGVVSPAIFATTYEILDRRARAERRPMALHQILQRLLLTGARLDLPAAPAAPNAPAALQPLIDAVAEPHQVFDARALVYGHRYRSGFWAIYMLSAVAVLCAMLPLALGWDNSRHPVHTFAGLWALNEVALIGTVTAIYWLGHRRDWQ